ncbi:pyridoxine 5'-phosphate synthase [Gammaproteobacteria bacterium SCGC AG-212-F23]|nr:pyridoxine 5'-phosphate synthase [Gammaproteobacteria bacterium SCGC AG-212-F23]
MTKLSVNINKIATLRNARGKNNPDVLKTALDIIAFGANGITVHPRPDGRHIRKEDVYTLANRINVEFNIEGYPNKDFLVMVKEVKAAQCTLVPDPPHVITSNAGWNVEKNFSLLQETVAELHDHGIRTSLFIDPFTLTDKEILLLKQIMTDRVELYTERYAEDFGTDKAATTLATYKNVATTLHKLGIDINAGHDLDLKNLRPLIQAIPIIKEVSIGHALICDALYFGLEKTIHRYLECLQG